MSADVRDLTGAKTMNTHTNVKLTNDDVRSPRPTGATSALTQVNGASETYRRRHAPRSAKPMNVELTGLHVDVSSTGKLRSSATRGSRVSECARSSLRLLGSLRVIYRPPIGDSPTDQVNQIHNLIWSQEGTAH